MMIAVLISFASGTRADTFAVGAACPHTTLATAVLAAWLTPGDDLIKVTQNLNNQWATLDDFKPSVRGSVTIRGGYTSCADTTSSGRSVIDGIATKPVFLVKTTSQSESIVMIENLELRGAERGAEVTAGGDLALNNVLVTDNDQGGVWVGTNGALGTSSLTQINHNGWGDVVPVFGGGIACQGGALSLRGEIDNNLAELGAGIGLASACTVELHSGLTITSNQATSNGGGIYASVGSLVVGGDAGAPVQIWGNVGRRGGGIYIQGSTFLGIGTAISANQAELDGGGIYAIDHSHVNLTGVGQCAVFLGCSEVSGNQLQVDGEEGSAVYAENSTVVLRRMTVEKNQLDPFYIPFLQPSLFYVTGADAELFLESSKIWNNRATALIHASDGATVFGGYLSSARNSYGLSGGGSAMSFISLFDGGTVVGIYSSILWDFQGFFPAGSPDPGLVVDCMISNTTHGVPLGSQFISTGNPSFFDAAAGDLRVPIGSPAVDYCDEQIYPYPGAPDFDGEARGLDHPGNPNGSPGVGVFDIGFDEIPPGVVPEIFSDDFELGNLSRWSAVVP